MKFLTALVFLLVAVVLLLLFIVPFLRALRQ
jgi:hypothetical protein